MLLFSGLFTGLRIEKLEPLLDQGRYLLPQKPLAEISLLRLFEEELLETLLIFLLLSFSFLPLSKLFKFFFGKNFKQSKIFQKKVRRRRLKLDESSTLF